MASTTEDGDPLCLLRRWNKFYLWHTATWKLSCVTEPYELQGILRRIKYGSVELQLKELIPLPRERFEPSGDYLQLSSEEIPNGWSNTFEDFDDLRQKVDAQELGLALPLPILSYEHFGLAYQLFQSGNRCYIFNQISSDVFRIEEPVRLQDILRTLNDTSREGPSGLKLKEVELLPEYGGPNRIPDNKVPNGWTNSVDAMIVNYDWCRGVGLSIIPNTLLYSESYMDGTSVYLFECQPSLRSAYYFWNPSLDDIYRIDETEGLPDILAALEDPSRKLKLRLLEILPGTESYRVADVDMPPGWMRVKDPDACRTMPWEEHGLPVPTPVLQRTGPNGDIPEYLVECGKGFNQDFYLWNAVSNDVHLVQAVMGLQSVFRVLRNPSKELKLDCSSSKKRTTSWWRKFR